MFYNGENEPQYETKPVPKVTASYNASATLDGLFVPLVRSVFIGFTLGVLAGLLSHVFSWPPGFSPWYAWLIVWFAVTSIAFLRYTERASWLIERITGADLNGDGAIGQPPTMREQPPALPESVRIEVVSDEGRAGDFLNLPCSGSQLKRLADGVVNQNREFALSLWVGTGRLFSRSEFEQLRAEMIARGLAEWRRPGYPNLGVRLTPQGKAVFRYLASEQYHPPLTR